MAIVCFIGGKQYDTHVFDLQGTKIYANMTVSFTFFYITYGWFSLI